MQHLSSEDRMTPETAPACVAHRSELSGAPASVFQAPYSYLSLPALVCLLFCVLWTPMIFDCMRGPQCNFFKQNLRCSPPSLCLLLSGWYRQHWAITLHNLGCELGDLGSSCSSVSLTHQTYSQMSYPYLNDFIWYSFLFVVGSIPFFCAIGFSFKRFGNYCNPRDRWKKQRGKNI